MKKTDQTTIFAFAWYKPEQWALLREYSTDRDALADTFFEWEAKAEEVFAQQKKQGACIQKVIIDIDELVEWCRSQNKPIDGNARSEFAIKLLREKEK